jgi:ATP-binding cassette subfamily B protein
MNGPGGKGGRRGRPRVTPGTAKRVLGFARPYRRLLILLVLTTAASAAITAVSPLLLKVIVDDGIVPGRMSVVVGVAAAIAGLALVDAGCVYLQIRFSSRVGEGLVHDLRTQAFEHVQKQPLAFFLRTRTGSLVSRLSTDVVGAREAVTSLLSQAVAATLTLVLVLAVMFYLSWQLSVAALLMIPIFLLPAKVIGRRLQRLTRRRMQLDADLGSLMNERFNASGAMLAILYGKRRRDADEFARHSGQLREVGASAAVYGRLFLIIVALLTTLTTALVYGLGGALAVDGTLEIGTLVAMVALLMRIYGPINQLSSIQVGIVTALISFERVFEVLDLRPLIQDRDGARPASPGDAAPEISFETVTFRYPSDEVSIASLEPAAEHSAGGPVLHDITFRVAAGTMTALVGPSGAGKTTISSLVSRLYDPTEGTVRLDGVDVRDLTLESLRDRVGVVSQDAHLFHDTIRANLLYGSPEATPEELEAACAQALILDTIRALPDGFDTVVGDRGYRFSGGEKQRLALARLLLKSPVVAVLDEATAHLDSDNEAAIQRALDTTLAGRTSLVIAHRLSTVLSADQILVVADCRIRERGTHDELLARGGLYHDLYNRQFATQEISAGSVDDVLLSEPA